MRSYPLQSASVLFLWIQVSACGMGLPETQDLGPLRVLAIQASSSEVNPVVDGSFTIAPVVSDLEAGSRTLTYRVEMCIDPGVSQGAPVTCEFDPTAAEPKEGTFTLDAYAPHYTGVVVEENAGDFTGAVPALILAGRSEVDLWNGVSYLVIFTVTAENGDEVQSFRRVIATTRTEGLNANPEITGLSDGDGVELLAAPTAETALRPILGASAAEEYTALALDGDLVTRTETLSISWFISRGALSSAKTAASTVEPGDFENTWSPPEEDDDDFDSPPYFYAVIRDDRGGVGFMPAPLAE